LKLLTNPNDLVGKPYDKETYHCYHFIEECLNVPKLDDIAVGTVSNDIERYKDLFTLIVFPIDYSIVLLGKTHIGIYHDGRIYHNDTQGVRCESLRIIKLKYNSIKYFIVKDDVCSL